MSAVTPSTHPRSPGIRSGLSGCVLVLLLLALGLAGCATNAPAPATRAFNQPLIKSDGTTMPLPGAVPREEPGAWAQEPRGRRTGLATTFGERRESVVHDTAFKRRDSSPRRQVTVHYNDRAGLDAMMAGSRGRLESTNCPMNLGWGADLRFGLRGEDGRWLPAWADYGRKFVEGRMGERYSIVLFNDSAVRREVVVSVDGLDVLDGQAASLRKRGYVLDPGQEFAVEGFRTGPDTVAAFRFGSVDGSYSQLRHGTARNVGVIGIALFDEKDRESERRQDADAFPGGWARPPGR